MKNISRTLTTYCYTTGRFDPKTMQVTDIGKHVFTYKLGQRDCRKLEKEVGFPIIAEEAMEHTYSMPLETFLQHATIVTDQEESEEQDDA